MIIAVLAGINCNAPRNNPLDPLNPDYNYGSIIGTVQTTGNPSFGVSGVNIFWENTNLNTRTDANGAFTLNNIPIEDGNIIFSRTGYKSDTLFVVWGSSKRFITLTFLNRIPTLDTVSIYTVVVNDFFPLQTAQLFVNAWVRDLDGDIDSVFVFNASLNLKKPLIFSAGQGNYQTAINEDSLNVNDIEETIGLDFSILVKDRSQNEYTLGSERITRVIKDQVTGLLPSTDDTVSSQPVVLSWNKFNAGYSFTYIIELYSNTFPNPQLIDTKTDIAKDSTSYTLPLNLLEGRYTWVIWIKDQFQNRSRSLPVNFRIP
ncbi:MAG TPA: carboxypeptidase-like regulatory domain-containing protein [Ignavibacteriaceae bacterium]|nr:carboxypeptidase-like regulatory domain-containing protein [Ignavibacteriaceae bacterium]